MDGIWKQESGSGLYSDSPFTKYKSDELLSPTDLKYIDSSESENSKSSNSGELQLRVVGEITEVSNSVEHISKDGGFASDSYACTVCGEEFTSWRKLRSHHQAHVKMPARHPFHTNSDSVLVDETLRTCLTCGESMPNSELLLHLRTHLIVGQRRCDLCEQVYTEPEKLPDHMNTHYGLEPYKCGICGNTYSLRQSLMKHITRIHKAVDPMEHYISYVPRVSKYKKKVFATKFAVRPNTNGGISTKNIACDYIPTCKSLDLEAESNNSKNDDKAEKNNPYQIRFECNFCARTFVTKYLVHAHEQKIHKEHRETSFSVLDLEAKSNPLEISTNPCVQPHEDQMHIKVETKTHTPQKHHETDAFILGI